MQEGGKVIINSSLQVFSHRALHLLISLTAHMQVSDQDMLQKRKNASSFHIANKEPD
jgi:hypothetical protein